jgi:hypothetical protein
VRNTDAEENRIREDWLKGLPTISGERKERKWHLRESTSVLAPFLALSGLLIYTVLSLQYYQFYSPLGVDPSEVGLTYANTLAHSLGFLITFVAIVILFVLIPLILGLGLAHALFPKLYRKRLPSWSQVKRTTVTIGISFILIVMTFMLVVSSRAATAARAVQRGTPISISAFRLGSVPLLSIHAEPVRVKPIGSLQQTPDIVALATLTNLVYLGQGDGLVLIYNPNNQEVVRIPQSAVVLHVSTCKSLTDQRCSNSLPSRD